jgi:hypothetical protein
MGKLGGMTKFDECVLLLFLWRLPFAEILLHTADVLACLLPQTRELLVFLSNAGSEVDTDFRILCLEDDGAISEDVLDDTALALVDVLKDPEIRTLMVIEGEECLLDAMDLLVRHDDDVEEVMVEATEELEVREEEEGGENGEDGAPARGVIEHERLEHDDAEEDDEDVPDEEAYEGPEESNPVLVVVELEVLSAVLSLEGGAEGGGIPIHGQRRK